MKIRTAAALFLLVLVPTFASFGQSPRAMSAAEIQLALKKLSVVGSALYVGAHPDDENTALLSYLAKGRLVRAAYLSMTRGEGGQNLIGSEQGELMGVIRTQELLAARRYDGAEQFFSRAIDFGYSKTSEETIQIWNHEKTLFDVVWIIRLFRPDVVITRFSTTAGGHGNHTASAIFAEEAYHAAGDPSRFPEQLKFVKPWTPKRILFNTSPFFNRQLDTDKALKLDVGEFNPLLGMSYSEIAGISRSMHKSQGFGASQSRGSQVHYFTLTAGEPAATDLFDGVNLTWSRMPGGEKVGMLLEQAYQSFTPENSAASIPQLVEAYREMRKLESNVWVETKKAELLEVLKACAGLWVDALAETYSATPASEVRDSVIIVKRSEYPVRVERVRFPFTQNDVVVGQPLTKNTLWHQSATTRLPEDIPYTQPYWLRQQREEGSYRVEDQSLIGRPENAPPLVATVTLRLDDELMEFTVPVRYRWVDPVEGELYRPFEIVPPVAINLHERVYIFHDGSQKTITATFRSGIENVNGEARLILPPGWVSTPSSIRFQIDRRGEGQKVSFSVGRGSSTSNGPFRLEAVVGGNVISQGIHTVDYRHIPPQMTFPSAEGKFVNLEVKLKGKNLGYITGSGDEVPTGLRQVGYNVTLLADEDLANGDLSRFDAIIAGVRVYNTRPAIRNQQKRLLEYVENGGTYIVQYVTRQRLESENLGPYPFEVGRDRVTVESAPMVFVDPRHALLHSPNTITEKDFEGWVQERGLYFAEKLNPKYETIFSSNDPGESPKTGSLIVAKYGKGYYIYTGLAFFRQIPAGVPGAYRLLVNMISIGK